MFPSPDDQLWNYVKLEYRTVSLGKRYVYKVVTRLACWFRIEQGPSPVSREACWFNGLYIVGARFPPPFRLNLRLIALVLNKLAAIVVYCLLRESTASFLGKVKHTLQLRRKKNH